MENMTELAHRPTRDCAMTIRDIADLAGVSIATVSRVVNGRDDVSVETRELVHASYATTASPPTGAPAASLAAAPASSA